MVPFFAPLFLILLTIFQCNAATTLNDTCANSTGFVPYSFCMVTLRSNPHSTHANTTTLAFISLNLAIINATSTKAKIDTLMNNTREPELKNGLQACDIVYSSAIVDLRSTGDFLRSAKFDTAKALVSAASTAGNECGDALRHVKVARTPGRRLLRKENGDFGLLTLLFLGVINPLL
jgi:pectinesterase inhibitor-like protein